jgi:hypothetical protein
MHQAYHQVPVDEAASSKTIDLGSFEDLEAEYATRRNGKRRLGMAAVTAAAGLVLIILLLLGIRSGFSHEQLPPARPAPANCGNSTAEAKAKGCHFDLLAYSWTPDECYDPVTDAEFFEWITRPERVLGPFPFFYHYNATQKVKNAEELGNAPNTRIYTTREEHLAHCAHFLRRIHRSTQLPPGKTYLTERSAGYEHSQHCSDEILGEIDNDELRKFPRIESSFGISYESCIF